MTREEEINQISQEELENALRIVGLFLCNDYHLDCTNGMTLRTYEGIAITTGWDHVARFFFLPELERIQKELVSYQLVEHGLKLRALEILAEEEARKCMINY